MDAIEGKNAVSMSREEKKELVQTEENVLKEDIKDLETWVDLMETMDDKQLEGYLKNNPDDLKKPRDQKMKKKVQSTGKSKSSNSTGIMASVWKFDKNLN
ncbi:unnamed protein product [Lathyrus sativus]|nr:unnamed protein product [Lathyrus sativus]